MKKVFQKNQMIIMTLAVVIAVAGYVNYSQKYDSAGTKNGKTKTVSKNVAKESAAAVTDDVTDVGEAVLTNAQVSNYVAKAKLEREQVHSKAKDTLEGIIKDKTVKDSVKQDAVDKLAMLSEQMEMETAAENLLGAKGFVLEESGLKYQINGNQDVCVSSTLNIAIDGVSSEALMISSKQYCGISNGSACTSSNYSPSYVLAAMGLDGSRIEASLRLSWGPNSDLKEVVDNFKKLLYVAKLMAN